MNKVFCYLISTMIMFSILLFFMRIVLGIIIYSIPSLKSLMENMKKKKAMTITIMYLVVMLVIAVLLSSILVKKIV